MSPEEAYELLESIAVISGTRDKLKKDKVTEAKKQQVRRPPINFTECGIPKGAELIYVEDPTLVVKVVSEHKVEYKGEITSLSAIAKSLKGYSVSGPLLFTYNGKLLTEIAEETQWRN